MANQNEIEEKLAAAIAGVEKAFEGEPHLRWNIVRGLIHRAVHMAAEGRGVEFCQLASYLGEMVGHGHKLMHGDNPSAQAHKDFVH
jgi:hypothetical protein